MKHYIEERYFYAPLLRKDNKSISLEGEEAHHILRVNRMKIGDRLCLSNGEGVGAYCEIIDAEKRALTCEVLDVLSEDRPNPEIELLVGLPRSPRFQMIVEKAVELGVSKITPILAERTVVKVKNSETFQSKWQQQSIAALKQCHRLHAIDIATPISFDQFAGEEANQFIFSIDGGVDIQDELKGIDTTKPIRVAIGPEGGFSEAEEKAFFNQGFKPILLPGPILRTETAVIAAISLFRYGVNA